MLGRVMSNAATSLLFLPLPSLPRILHVLGPAGTDGEGEGGVAAGVMTFGECARLGVDREQRETREQFFQDDAGLQPGGDSAEAVMRADGESQVTRPAS